MTQRHASKDEALLVGVAESIGSTLGQLAAKASAAPEILSEMAHAVGREGNKLKRKTKSVARKITGTRWSGPSFFGLKQGSRAQDRSDD